MALQEGTSGLQPISRGVGEGACAHWVRTFISRLSGILGRLSEWDLVYSNQTEIPRSSLSLCHGIFLCKS